MEHILDYSLLKPKQEGFLQSRSCSVCFLDVLNLLTNLANRGIDFAVIRPDRSKVIGRVPHPHLTFTVSSLGIANPLLA